MLGNVALDPLRSRIREQPIASRIGLHYCLTAEQHALARRKAYGNHILRRGTLATPGFSLARGVRRATSLSRSPIKST